MTDVPPHGSPGAPQLSYANPTSSITPRRSSYASVAAGTASQPLPSQSSAAYLSHMVNPSSYTQNQGLDQPSRLSQATNDPEQMEGGTVQSGFGARGGSTFGHSPWRFSNQNYVAGGGTPGFFTPSYLKGSKYMEQLEAAHKARAAAQREENVPLPTRHSNPGSLSTSSSSVSLHTKLSPSHRGVSYEINEHQSHLEDLVPLPLPSRWAQSDKWGGLEIVEPEGLEVRFVGHSKLNSTEAAAARSDYPMPVQSGIYYYEVTIISRGKDGMIGVGFSGASASLEKLPGWEPESWAYHGDDGNFFCGQGQGKTYGPTFGTGDVIGCGVNFTTGCTFFTKNGVHQGDAFKELKDVKLYPSIGMKRPNAKLSVNFGQKPFWFDIDGLVSRERQTIKEEINKADVSLLGTSLNQDEICKALVAQYLSHDGYVETAKIFANEVRGEESLLKGSKESKLEPFLAVEEDHDATNRQKIRTAILEGDIDTSLKLVNSYYPHVLASNPTIYFRLRCRKFLEMMRQSAETLDASTNKQSKLNGHSRTVSEDGFDNDMDLDEPMKDGDEWDRMDTDEAEDGINRKALNAMIAYGQELKTEFRDDHRRSVQDTMTEIFSLFAHKDPRTSEQGRLLDTSQRVPVAEGLNAAILVSLGKSSSTALERLYKQAVVLVDILSNDGGPGCLINVSDILKAAGPERDLFSL